MLYILQQKKIIGISSNHKFQPMSYTLMQLNIRPKFINLIEFVTVWVHFRYRTSEAKVQILYTLF